MTTWTKSNRVGLVLLGIYGLANLIPAPPGDAKHPGPPLPVIVADMVLGVVILAAVVLAWRNRNRKAAGVASIAAVLAALTAVPAFFVDGVPDVVRAIVAVSMVWALIAIVLTLSRSKDAG